MGQIIQSPLKSLSMLHSAVRVYRQLFVAKPNTRVLPTPAAVHIPSFRASTVAATGTAGPPMEVPPYWTAALVREVFINFFKSKSHTPWPSSPVVPVNDGTLLFTNAGMNGFKPIFLGLAPPDSQLGRLRRACNTQKCIRAGGKHNDLDDVGKDTYHHTFFEMLGNWSFGDYFNDGAIGYAWDLLTQVYKLPTDRIYATYFGGDEKAGLAPDTESKNIWLKYLPNERVLPFGCKDNFWEMGDTGPCGPCTEIHFDRIGNRDAASLVNNDDPTCIEIWNLVFIQFNRESDGTLRSLPAKHVDTGMGLERLTSILQNKMSNYDTDVFMPLFDAIHKLAGVGIQPYSGKVGSDDVGKVDMAYRVVADHIRTLSFAIADGSQPGNEGREYVLRRILRRAVHFGRQKLMAKQGFFSSLVDVFVQLMGDVFPELKDNEKKIKDIIKDEEASFEKTLVKGYERFKKAADAVKENGRAVLSGQDAFVLWDTYGYPIDLTEVMGVDFGLSVDMEGFNLSMEEARQKARNARYKAGGKSIVLDANATSQLHNQGLTSTNDSPKFQHEVHSSVVKAIYTGSEFIATVSGDEDFGLVLESTSFYAEQGGQIYDTGSIEGPSGSFTVNNVQVFAGYVLHACSFLEGPDSKALSVGDEVKCKIYPDPVRVVSIGRKVEDLLANPESKEWLSISTELCGGTHISNTRDAAAFALISEEGIAKGVRRITAVTAERASQAMKLASSIDTDINEASKLDGATLEKKIGSIKNTLDVAAIPAARKADLRGNVSKLEDQLRKEKKKMCEENIRRAVKTAIDAAEAALSEGKPFCVTYADVGLDTTALREAVVKAMNRSSLLMMVFSTDEASNKAAIYAGVPPNTPNGFNVLDWLTSSIAPLKGRGGGGKNGLAQGQGSDASRIKEAMELATQIAKMKLSFNASRTKEIKVY
ncbi:hypothetical protein VPH35_122701 [Triticum aestivum]